MSNSINKVNYDELTQIAKQLHSESEEYTRLNSQTRQRIDALRGGWQGNAANAFFNEMNAELIPATQRLSSALLAGESVINQIMQITRQADEETASYFKGLDTGGDGTKKKTVIYLINGINYNEGTEADQQKLIDGLKAKYGDNVEVVIVKSHPYDSNLAKYAPVLSPLLGPFLAPIDFLTGYKISRGILGGVNTMVGIGQVINEYVTGGSTESQKVNQWIENNMRDNGLIGNSDVNVILVGHSGAGAIIPNIVGNLEQLGVNVSGVVTLGSPISNYDQASQYAEKILDIHNRADLFGTPLGLGTLRSDETRLGMSAGLISKWSIPASFALDPYFRDSTVNLQNVTTTDGGYDWWNPLKWGDAHGSYWNSPAVVDS